jgi:ribosomal protein L15E
MGDIVILCFAIMEERAWKPQSLACKGQSLRLTTKFFGLKGLQSLVLRAGVSAQRNSNNMISTKTSPTHSKGVQRYFVPK